MMINLNPWTTMSASSQRRIDYETNHDIYWVKDFYGHFGFCLNSRNGLIIDENRIKLKGVSIYKRNINENIVELYLILKSNEEWEIFLALCEDLIAVTKKYKADIEMINAVVNRLERWQQLLKQERNQLLTIEKQMGLYSELLCLRDFVAKKVGIKQSIISWVGPESDKQDFLLDDAVIEVKSHRTSKGNFAHISSYHQLNSEKDPLYLFSYSLTPSENGKTIQDISENIRALLKSEPNDIVDLFETKLIDYGFIPEINKGPWHKFNLDKLKVFYVDDTFPKITLGDFKNEIVSVKYTIDLSKCSEFEVDIKTLLEGEDSDD